MLIRIFLISFILSLPFWWEMNILQSRLENFFYWREISGNSYFLTAQINQRVMEEKLENLKPLRNWQIKKPDIEAKSVISVFFSPAQNRMKILFEKRSNEKLPIASLVKLMTANVVLENYELSQEIEISKTAAEKEKRLQNLKIGEKFLTKDLLYSLLMESDNAAAASLAELTGEERFVELMNSQARNLGLTNTYFINPTGLDPEDQKTQINHSTSQDLVKLSLSLLENQPLIWEVLSKQEFELYTSDGIFNHKVLTSNELFGKIPEIVGGKTGETPRAGGCLLLILRAPNNQGFLINIILGSPNRFGEMEKLANWIKAAYRWQ